MYAVYNMSYNMAQEDIWDEVLLFETNQTDYYGICSDGFGDLNSETNAHQLNVLC